jgi:hypothetical protein
MSPRWGTEGGGTARATLRNGCGRRPSSHPTRLLASDRGMGY